MVSLLVVTLVMRANHHCGQLHHQIPPEFLDEDLFRLLHQVQRVRQRTHGGTQHEKLSQVGDVVLAEGQSSVRDGHRDYSMSGLVKGTYSVDE